MAHTALFRKYRSQTFADLTGQDHITRTLRNALRMERVAHAYLFCGPRGTGKTSSARIFAKALNCTGPDPTQPLKNAPEEPCDRCANCRNIAAGMCLDVIEMDAASNTGIDSVRDAIIGKADYQPVEGRRKVYIVDEVHKLSSSAFAALLKTLEEPPEHLIFLLATTDPNDLPATILSRCQRFDFRRISQRDIVGRLDAICKHEGIQIDDDALDAIAEAADGGLRDALVILEQAAAYADGPITLEVVANLLGVTDRRSLFELTRLVLGGHTAEALSLLNELMRQGRDLLALARDMLGHMRALLLAQVVPNATKLLNVSDEIMAQLKAQGEEFDARILMTAATELIDLEKKLKESVHGRLNWEVAIIRRLAPMVASPHEAPAEPPAMRPQPQRPAPSAPQEQRAHAPQPEAARPQPQQPAPPPPAVAFPQHHDSPPLQRVAPSATTPHVPAPATPTPPPAGSGPVTLEAFQEAWPQLVESMRKDKTGGSLHVFLADCHPHAVEGSNCIFISPGNEKFLAEKMAPHKGILTDRLSLILGQQVQVKLRKVDPATLAARTRAAPPTTPEQAHLDFVEEAKHTFGGKTS